MTTCSSVSPLIISNQNLKKGRTAFTFLPRSPAVDTIQSQRCPSLKLKPSSNETYDVPKQQIYHQKFPKICVFYADISSVYHELMNNRINQVAKLLKKKTHFLNQQGISEMTYPNTNSSQCAGELVSILQIMNGACRRKL